MEKETMKREWQKWRKKHSNIRTKYECIESTFQIQISQKGKKIERSIPTTHREDQRRKSIKIYPRSNRSFSSTLQLRCSSCNPPISWCSSCNPLRIEKRSLQLSHQPSNKFIFLTTHHTTALCKNQKCKTKCKINQFHSDQNKK